MGSVYAGLLSAAGNEVWAIDIWEPHILAIQKSGLRVEGKSGDRTVRINATTNAADVGPCDLVVIATKAGDVEQAAKDAAVLLQPNTPVLTIQNGLGSPEKVAAILGAGRVVIGVVGGFGASVTAPGHVHHHGMELLYLGELGGPATRRLAEVAKVWRDAGFPVSVFDDITQGVWEKLIFNVCFSATCALTGMTIGKVIADEDAWLVASGCATEAFLVARERGTPLGFEDPVEYTRAFGLKIPKARPSMLQDHFALRRSEVDVINGAIVLEGEKLGVPTPFNTAVTAFVRARERELGLR
jgi:2-dehydropantoate 2-reductase